MRFPLFGIPAVLALLFFGCTTAPKKPTSEGAPSLNSQVKLACESGKEISEITGSVIVAASEMKNGKNGQLPASVSAISPDKLKLETMHLLGGTLGRLEISEGRYRYYHDDQTQPSKEGTDSYQGIPVRWAAQLFIGAPPCPVAEDINTLHCTQLPGSSETLSQIDCKLPSEEQYLFTMHSNENRFWITALDCKLNDSSEKIGFQFENPEKDTLAFQTWTVSSSAGKVKVRWRKRSLTLAH